MSTRVLSGMFVGIWALLTACMGDPAGTVNYHRVGVVRENPMRCIYTTDDQGNIFIVSSADFENRSDVRDGDCCLVDFKTNFSETLAEGVYDAEIYQYDSVAVWPVHAELTDTTVVLEDERLVTLDFKKSVYLEGCFFLQARHTNHQEDQKDIYHLSYDPERPAEETEKGESIYDLYLRVTWEPGTGDSTSWVSTTAFTIDSFLEHTRAIESGKGKDRVNFRINYADSFNADTTACVWAATDVFTLRFTN